MVETINRAQFLSGDFHNKGGLFRPPWALDEARFLDTCTGCGDCITACPEEIIKEGRGKYPVMDFSAGFCDFCEDCAKACKPQALLLTESDAPAWNLKAEILENCLSLNKVMCRSCGDVCDERAIRFELKTGGIAIPHLNREECTGCGGCFTVCPGKAVKLDYEKNLRVNAA